MISPVPVKKLQGFNALQDIEPPKVLRKTAKLLLAGMMIAVMFLILVPWVQTSYGTGKVIPLDPRDRPQPLNALVPGRIKQWYVQEGDFVKEGQPLLELVDNDANLIERLEAELQAQREKLDAAEIGARTAKLDWDRQRELHEKGLSARRVYEQAKISYNQKRSEESTAVTEYNKAKVRLAQQGIQTVRAPRDGMIINILPGFTSTALMAGDRVAEFVPTDVTPAVELYVDGVDISLIEPGRKVRLQFEGWPVVQFSGWPATAIGTFGGIVQSVDPSISPNGRFRLIVVPDPDAEAPWPASRFLRLGAKVKGWVMLETVSSGYELWRQLNNFPPEFAEPPATSMLSESK